MATVFCQQIITKIVLLSLCSTGMNGLKHTCLEFSLVSGSFHALNEKKN